LESRRRRTDQGGSKDSRFIGNSEVSSCIASEFAYAHASFVESSDGGFVINDTQGKSWLGATARYYSDL